MLYLDYPTFIGFYSSANLQLIYAEDTKSYTIFGVAAAFAVGCLLAKDGGADQTDFEANYKSLANKPIAPVITTQYEKRDKTLKLACASGDVGSDGSVTVYLKVPGTPNPTGDITLDGRWIDSGVAFFDVATAGDMVKAVKFVDHDNILGQGVDFIVGSYTDDAADASNQGWFVPVKHGQVEAEPIGGYGFAPAGFYIMVVAQKGGGLTTGTFFINLAWGADGS